MAVAAGFTGLWRFGGAGNKKVSLHTDLLARVAELERVNDELRKEIAHGQPFYRAMMASMVASLTHGSEGFAAADALLVKALDDTLTPADHLKFDDMLIQRAIDRRPEITVEERLIAGTLPTVMLLAAAERKSDSPATVVLVIGAAKPDRNSGGVTKAVVAQQADEAQHHWA